MSLSHSSFTFFNNPSGPVNAPGPHDQNIIQGQFPGVIGESHIVFDTFGANLRCAYRFQGYSTAALLRADLITLEGKQGYLTGTLTDTLSGSPMAYRKCTFLGFQPFDQAPWLDGSGVYGWIFRGQLLWRQRIRG